MAHRSASIPHRGATRRTRPADTRGGPSRWRRLRSGADGPAYEHRAGHDHDPLARRDPAGQLHARRAIRCRARRRCARLPRRDAGRAARCGIAGASRRARGYVQAFGRLNRSRRSASNGRYEAATPIRSRPAVAVTWRQAAAIRRQCAARAAGRETSSREPFMPNPTTVSRRELANAIRALAMDAVEAAKSGHPGMPMGMADIAEVLWNDFLSHNPANPKWSNRDRFVLSNGHGSMLLYSLLHLTGYDFPIDEIKRFRQLH